MHLTLFSCGLSPSHTIIVLVIGILLFGRKLPEVGRSLGRGFLEFRKGLVGIDEGINDIMFPEDRVMTAAPLSADSQRRFADPSIKFAESGEPDTQSSA